MRKLLSLMVLGSLLASCSSQPNAAESAPESSATAATSAQVATASSAGPEYFQEKGVAIRGADPVAYFTDAAYVQGSEDFTHDWQGATWQFASAENRDAFAADPDAYAPQYGGFCAYAVSQGYTADIEPEAWKIVEGKLYLNYNKKIQKKWEKDIPGYIAAANTNWPGVLN